MPDEEVPLVRIAEALESIAKSLEKIANPLVAYAPDGRGTEHVTK